MKKNRYKICVICVWSERKSDLMRYMRNIRNFNDLQNNQCGINAESMRNTVAQARSTTGNA